MNNTENNIRLGGEVVVVDVDDTILDIGDRRMELYRQHFPKSDGNTSIRHDPTLKSIGDRDSTPVQTFLNDFSNPDKISNIPVSTINGAVDAISALEAAGLQVVLLTGRSEKLREVTLDDLKENGLDWSNKRLVMHDSTQAIDPLDDSKFGNYKNKALNEMGQHDDIIAVIGNSASDVLSAFQANIPAILLCVPPIPEPEEDFENKTNVGFCKCKSWEQALIEIGAFRHGEKQLIKLRDSFTNAYTSWLRNLNNLCAIDVAIASALAALSGAAVMADTLSLLSRIFALVPLILSLLALIFAIRAFTSKYSSGSKASKSISTKTKQALSILFNHGTPKEKAREGDAVYEYLELRKKETSIQATAHRQFFYSRYEEYNPSALMNLRMYEMRMLNYVRVYAEHIASSILIWAATSLVVWLILVSFLDPSLNISNEENSISSTTNPTTHKIISKDDNLVQIQTIRH